MCFNADINGQILSEKTAVFLRQWNIYTNIAPRSKVKGAL